MGSPLDEERFGSQAPSEDLRDTEEEKHGGRRGWDKVKKMKKWWSTGSSINYLLRVFTYNDRLGWLMNAVAFICMIVSGAILPLMDLIFGKFINVFNDFVTGQSTPADYRASVNQFSLYFVYLFIAKFVLTYIWTVLISITGIRATKALRVDFVRQILRQEVSFFDSSSASVAGQITTNGNLVSAGISEKFGIIVSALSSFVVAFVVAFSVQWKLTLIIISVVPINVVVNFVCLAIDTAYENAIFNIYAPSNDLAQEAFSSIRTAHAFWAFPKLSSHFDGIMRDAARVGAKKSMLYAIVFPVDYFFIFACYALAFWRGIHMYASGEIENPGTVVTVVFAILVAAQALTEIMPQAIAMTKAAAAAQDLFSVIDRQSQMDSLSSGGAKIPEFQGDIKLRSVHFAYPSRPGVPVLHGLDLDIPANQTTALVGASGSGKSTIFGLLERWYSPQQGSIITLDGHSIEDLNLQWLRTNIRLVEQEPTLFSGTVFQNVVDGLTGTEMAGFAEDKKRKLVQEACEAAFAHDFIQGLPKGYDTWIGERGASLSGGQKQRIVIARSIISNPKVLLLDEATSALDPNAEKMVQKALNNVGKGRTMVVIAHRLSTIQDADNIIVMSKGATIEQGTHSQLMDLGGAYAGLVQAQHLGHGQGATEQRVAEREDEGGADLDVMMTPAPEAPSHTDAPIKGKEMFGLLKGVYLVVKEQRPLWTYLTTTACCCIVAGGAYPALAVLFSETLQAFQNVDVGRGNFYSLMFFVVSLGNLFSYAIIGWVCNSVGQHIMKVYRSELFRNTMRQEMAFFDQPENGTGALVSRLSSEPTALQELLSINVALIAINIVSLLASSILAIVYGWKLGLVLVFGALPVLVGAGYVRIRLEYRFDDDTEERFAKSSGLATEAVSAIRTVSSLALECAIIERYHASLQGLAKEAIGGLGLKMFFYSLSQSTSYLAMGLGFWYGGHLVSTGEYSVSQFYVVFVAVVFSGEAAASLFQYSTSISKARTAMNYIFRLRRDVALGDNGTRDTEQDENKDASDDGMVVECDSVKFAYPLRPKVQVLQGIDVDIGAGKMVAFVGASGCGKSTMMALLERFYDPSAGVIRAAGRDIRTQDRRWHRRDIALVQQEPVLYKGSIRDNVAIGIEDGDPAEEAIVAACQQANVWEFIASLPEGLNTPCGNQGLSLSGGQRQRIAIARALIRRPRLLLLDEATSALDTESEKVVKEALNRAAMGRTTVAVAHRLSTIRDADVIVVLSRGKVAQVGTHDELVARRGIYYEMVLGQSLDREAAS